MSNIAAPPSYRPSLTNEINNEVMAAIPNEQSSKRKAFHESFDKYEPVMRSLTLPIGLLSIPFCPAAFVVSRQRNLPAIIVALPLMLSALSTGLFIKRRHEFQRKTGAALGPGAVPLHIGSSDFFLALFHVTMLSWIYVNMGNMSKMGPSGYGRSPPSSTYALSSWLSTLVIIDFFVHSTLFLNFILKYVCASSKVRYHCPRCGCVALDFSDQGVAAAIPEATADIEQNRCAGLKGGFTLFGNYTDDSDFSEGPSGRPSQETNA